MHKLFSVKPLLLLSVSLLVACQVRVTTQTGNNALSLPSARIETRDSPSQEELSAPTQVVILGTGTPIPDAFRAGSSIAVVHKGESYLFDVGAGAIRQATIARYRYDIPSLYPSQICCAFLSHLHSDHSMDLSELAHTLWWRRKSGLEAWGPRGIDRIAAGLDEIIAIDADFRINGIQPVTNPNGFRVNHHTISPGILLQKDDLVIEAFLVNHGDIDPAFGFKVTTDDLSLVISGDTAYSDVIAEKARGVDLLFHEVISRQGLAQNSPDFQRYHNSVHTTSAELARLAAIAEPATLVLYHGLFYGTEESTVLDEIQALYAGEVVLANDLDIFTAD
ncbi:MAG: MBL fold metallo-hydrolase [Gammaproteobacteria bacterium]|nr:MBL fold metallo-hydrolase [Gammaproteobacteria bacterium]MDD9894343.1 MBL fold metallo-hydrolase [Gammaproteobacteria bacterium]MDD9957663.1 MBL fold metallo-hydrolase [Gammaproteobacteria bacterium]